jgi:xanthine dehydrogenase accessory factor
MNDLVIVRGAGDIATGVIQKLHRAGFKVVSLEVPLPTAIRRKVSLCEAIYEGEYIVEDIKAKKIDDICDLDFCFSNNVVPIIIDSKGDIIEKLNPIAVVDATLCKKNIGTSKSMAPITIALGPGYEANKDVDIVIETMRGHNLGRLIFKGPAQKNTGIPGKVGGFDKERVIHSTCEGNVKLLKDIGSFVKKGELICKVNDAEIYATIDGLLRGIIREDSYVPKGMKIADIDPRKEEYENCFTISDKARTIGGAVLEGLLFLKNDMYASNE